MAVLNWGSTGPEVEDLQQRLKATSYFTGVVDGSYGALTYFAVKRFQESQGLPADGVAGPETLTALGAVSGAGADGPTGGSGQATSRAMSLHIGLNRVDPARYGGWSGVLSGCERDAGTMAAIAEAEGFRVRRLNTAQATSTAILREIRWAAQALEAGSTFLLSYAGHGGQVADPSGEEPDSLDETWVAYDRQILDDELEQVFSEFQAGVDIVVVSDSCHSGTVVRPGPPGARSAPGQDERSLQRNYAELKASFYRGLVLSRPGPGEPPFASFPRPPDMTLAPEDEIVLRATAVTAVRAGVAAGSRRRPVYVPEQPAASRSADVTDTRFDYATREIPFEDNEIANEIQKADLVRAKVRARERAAVQAGVLLLAGCQDNQLSQEAGGAGVFTSMVNRVWAANTFSGDYRGFLRQVVAQMGPTQTPNLLAYGGSPEVLVAKTPFDVGSDSEQGAE